MADGFLRVAGRRRLPLRLHFRTDGFPADGSGELLFDGPDRIVSTERFVDRGGFNVTAAPGDLLTWFSHGHVDPRRSCAWGNREHRKYGLLALWGWVAVGFCISFL